VFFEAADRKTGEKPKVDRHVRWSILHFWFELEPSRLARFYAWSILKQKFVKRPFVAAWDTGDETLMTASTGVNLDKSMFAGY